MNTIYILIKFCWTHFTNPKSNVGNVLFLTLNVNGNFKNTSQTSEYKYEPNNLIKSMIGPGAMGSWNIDASMIAFKIE